jgi:hypothetical protein
MTNREFEAPNADVAIIFLYPTSPFRDDACHIFETATSALIKSALASNMILRSFCWLYAVGHKLVIPGLWLIFLILAFIVL